MQITLADRRRVSAARCSGGARDLKRPGPFGQLVCGALLLGRAPERLVYGFRRRCPVEWMAVVGNFNPDAIADQLVSEHPECFMYGIAVPSDAPNRVGTDHGADFFAIRIKIDSIAL